MTSRPAVGDLRRARARVLDWYGPRRSLYPWRRTRDPYRVLVSEVMLQQTQASRVVPAYRAFVRRYPTLASLARAPRSEVIAAWNGLGYNRRAVALSDAARVIVQEHLGRIPSEPELLARLPGVGPYTAAAVDSLAFGRAVPAIDTNVRRVVARVLVGVDPVDAASGEVRRLAARWVDRDDPGAWNQALMDLGREVCRPRPRCERCPIRGACRFLADGREPGPSARRRPPFRGSTREARGAVVRSLRPGSATTLGTLVARTGLGRPRIVEAVAALHADGLIEAGPAALAGSPRGCVRLRS